MYAILRVISFEDPFNQITIINIKVLIICVAHAQAARTKITFGREKAHSHQ